MQNCDMPQPAPLHASGPTVPLRYGLLLQPEHQWQARASDWRTNDPMRDDRKHTLNIYWRGEGAFQLRRQHWPIAAPCCLLKGPLETSRIRWQPGTILESWIVMPGVVADLLRAGGQLDRDRRVVPLAEPQRIRAQLDALATTMRGPDPAWGLVLARLQMLVASMWADAPATADPDRQRITDAVSANPGQHWTLKRLAALCACSPAALRQRFHRRHGCGPCDHVTAVRMDLARELLADRLIKQVAHALGYRDQSSFTRRFKAHHGMSPRQFQRLVG